MTTRADLVFASTEEALTAWKRGELRTPGGHPGHLRDARVAGCAGCEKDPVPHFGSSYCESKSINERNPNGRTVHCTCDLCF